MQRIFILNLNKYKNINEKIYKGKINNISSNLTALNGSSKQNTICGNFKK